MLKSIRLLTRFERGLWLISAIVVTASFFLGKEQDPLSLITSLVGITCLIFTAKGLVIGQVFGIFFALLYAIISYGFRYYGEMLTYLCMSMPIAIAAVITWIRNPAGNEYNEVKVASLTKRKVVLLFAAAIAVTGIFYFILKYFNTAQLIISTVSVTTSFLAASLTMLRSSWYAIGYAANDIILITLWILAAIEDISCLPMIFCFLMFLVNDSYAFYNWQRMKRRQALGQ